MFPRTAAPEFAEAQPSLLSAFLKSRSVRLCRALRGSVAALGTRLVHEVKHADSTRRAAIGR